MGPTKVDPVDHARAIVHACLARERRPANVAEEEPERNTLAVLLLAAGVASGLGLVLWCVLIQ